MFSSEMIAKSIRSQLDTMKHGSCETFGCCFRYLGQPIGKYMMFSLFATNLSISHIVYIIHLCYIIFHWILVLGYPIMDRFANGNTTSVFHFRKFNRYLSLSSDKKKHCNVRNFTFVNKVISKKKSIMFITNELLHFKPTF